MNLKFKNIKKEILMKLFSFLAIALIAIFAIACPAQTQSPYTIFWTANPASDNVTGYAVYLEGRVLSTGFNLVDGAEYTPTIDAYKIADVPAGATVGEITYDVTLPNDGKNYIAGVIAYTTTGVKSVLSAMTTPYKVDKQPGKPAGVGIRKK
jgi:hypothetical protein